jgi:hypothetical protein
MREMQIVAYTERNGELTKDVGQRVVVSVTFSGKAEQ